MKRISIILLASTTLFAAACGGKKTEGAAKGSDGDKGGAPAAATKLPALGLQLDVPGDVNVGDAIGAKGHMLQGSGIGAMQIEAFDKPKTLDEAKTDAADYSPKNVKGETLPDGWTLTYDNSGSMGANYFVTVRRDIGGASYKCSTTGSDPKQAEAVLAACKSLRK
jgi:hypothetical protein